MLRPLIRLLFGAGTLTATMAFAQQADDLLAPRLVTARLPVAPVRSGGRARCLLITSPAGDEASDCSVPVQSETGLHAPDEDVAAAEGAEVSVDAEAQAQAVLTGLVVR
jgi:hypothetical protein